MKLVFGWHLDGSTYPITTTGAKLEFNSAVVGPNGFLNLLENQFALGYPETHLSERIAQYLARLKQLDDGNQFYSNSFRNDPWAVAEYLLSARDTLNLHGWIPKSTQCNEGKLTVFKQLECDHDALLPGYGEKLSEVLSALRQEAKTDISELTLTTPMKHLPAHWVEILSRLKESGTKVIERIPQPHAANPGDLLSVQNLLTGSTYSELAGDDTIVLLESDDEIQAAEATAAWLASAQDRNQELVIICSSQSSQLDQACRAIGLPRIAKSSQSRWRAALQILSLVFDQSWRPLNVLSLLQLLTLPGSPVPRSISHLFTDALREEPGIGGAAWSQAWELAHLKRKEQLNNDGLAEPELSLQVSQDLSFWRQWLEPVRFDPAQGIPVLDAQLICRRVQEWTLRKASVAKDETLFPKAAAQCSAMERAMQNTGLDVLTRVQLDRILDSVLAAGAELPGACADAAPWTAVEKPGQIWNKAKTILWWTFTEINNFGQDFLWTKNEIADLEKSGISLETASSKTIRDAFSWRYPILNATANVLLVRPRMLAGREALHHPLWQEMSHIWKLSNSNCTRHAEELYISPSVSILGRQLKRQPVESRQMPVPAAEINIPANLISRRQLESASSLEKLFACPFSWTLQYQAHLKPGALISLHDDESLIGILAHKVIALLFAEKKKWEPFAAKTQALVLFDQLVSSIGTQLIAPGKLLSHEKVRIAISRSVEQLAKLLSDAELEVVGCEQDFQRQFHQAEFKGTIDLLLKDSSQRKEIIDLKWTNSPAFRRKSLVDGTAIQLAAYSWLIDEPESNATGAGYYMLKQSRLYHSSNAPFPLHAFIPGTDLVRIWKNTEQTFQDHLDKLGSGSISVAGLLSEAQRDAQHIGLLSLEPPCAVCSFGRLCGKKLKEQ